MISSGSITRWITVSSAAVLVATPQRARRVVPLQHAAVTGTRVIHDGQHDFDFEIGTWHTHLKRLLHPLTGSNTWAVYDGVTVVRKVWGGRANLAVLEVDGPAGHIEGLSLRLYDPQSGQWSLNFANASTGTLAVPSIGEFHEGQGEFYDQEAVGGRVVLDRFVIRRISRDTCRFEQAYSDDGGRTWEVNWIATDVRSPAGASSSPDTRPKPVLQRK
jgi:hypothetical protein